MTSQPHHTRKKKYSSHCLSTYSCGSLIVEVAVEFTSIVSESLVVDTLRTAAEKKNLEEFRVNASSIRGIAVIESASTSPTEKTTGRPTDGIVQFNMYTFLHSFSVIRVC